jgi:hypothetical protein
MLPRTLRSKWSGGKGLEGSSAVASTSKLSSTRPSSSAAILTLSPISSSTSTPTTPHDGKRRNTSWATLSHAGQALFGRNPSSATTKQKIKLQDSITAVSFLEELSLPRPNADKLWASFNALDLAGETHLLSAHLYTKLIRNLHQDPPLVHNVFTATNRAASYSNRVEFIKLRMTQAGRADDGTIEKAALKQFAALKYAPGVCQVWDRVIVEKVPSIHFCSTVFQTTIAWIGLHSKAGGKDLAALAAAPLVTKALSMLRDLSADDEKTEIVLEHFFEIVRIAKNMPVFKMGMKEVYGFDMDYPGAEIQVVAGSKLRVMGEKEVAWVLSILADQDELSKMIGVFETFDDPAPATPSPPSTTVPTYFGQSFALSDPIPTTPQPDTTASTTLHPIGTRAYSLMISTAGRLDQGHIVRHYFRQLSLRWEASTTEKIGLIEEAVGIIPGENRISEVPSTFLAFFLNADVFLLCIFPFPLQPSKYLKDCRLRTEQWLHLLSQTKQISFNKFQHHLPPTTLLPIFSLQLRPFSQLKYRPH